MTDSDIITRCPQCNTAFRVTQNQLAVADGVVRCGSCLAVFKAIDYKSRQGETVTPIAKAQKPTEKHEPIESEHITKQSTKSVAHPSSNESPTEEELINDSVEDNDITFEDGFYDLNSENKKAETSLFERKLTPASEQTRDNQDENWALDMLAELECDDEIEPLKFKRKSKLEPEPEPEAEPENNHSLTVTEAEHKPEPEPQITVEKLLGDKKVKDSQEEALYFDHDDYTNEKPHDTRTLNKQMPSRKKRERKKSPEVEPLYESSPTTDDDIHNPLDGQLQYEVEKTDYLSGIEPAPVEMEWLDNAGQLRRLWLLGAIFAALLLTVQVLTFRFNSLSINPSYRPIYQTACNLLGCELPAAINTQKILTTNLIVRSHSSQKNALIVDAILINNAQFNQPYPALRLEFTDLNNNLIAVRNLQPKDYLRGELAGASIIPSGQPVQISLAIQDPGPLAVNYQLTVIQPDNTNLQ